MQDTYVDGDGIKWTYDADQATRLVRKYALTRAIHENTSAVATREGWFQKLRLLPPTGEMAQDWRLVEAQCEKIQVNTNKAIAESQKGGWTDYQAHLIHLRRMTEQYHAAYQGTLASIQDMNAALIGAAEAGMKAAKLTRDVSIMGVAVIATVATGGATTVLASSIGSVGSAAATYQDTGSGGKAALSGALFLVPVGVKHLSIVAKSAQVSSTVIASVSIAVEFGAETVGGVVIDDQKFVVALRNAGINTALGATSDHLAGWMGNNYRNAIRVMDTHGARQSNRAWPLIAEATTSGVSEMIKFTSSKLIDSKPSTPAEAALGGSAGGMGPVPFAYKRDKPLMCMSPPVQTDCEATRFVKQNVLARV